jgi:(p)ppGpp synthase/HD superfamily hydrolase
MQAYSDRINHALGFAAKHHDRQVREGIRLPYHIRPASVAIILARYGCDDDAVVAGILHDTVEDLVRAGWTREMLSDRIGDKFGSTVLKTVLSVTYRKGAGDGIEFDADQQRADFLVRLAQADDRARWVCAADQVHSGNSILADLRRTKDRESVWCRFSAGRDGTIGWYRLVHDRLKDIGFVAPIIDELRVVTEELEQYGSVRPSQVISG